MKPTGWGDAATPKVLGDLRAMLGGGLTFKDNVNCAIITLDCQHGVETRVTNPLRTVPIAFFPISSMSITAIGGQSNGAARPIDDYPTLNTSRTDGFLGVTVNYELNHTQPCLIRTASAVQAIAHGGGGAALTGWNTTSFSRGSVISDNGSIFTVTEAGTYSVAVKLPFEAGTYTAADLWINTGTVVAEDYRALAFTDRPIINVATIVQLAAGGTITAFTYHTNAAVAARNVTTERRIAIHRLFNDTVPLGRVTGILVGG